MLSRTGKGTGSRAWFVGFGVHIDALPYPAQVQACEAWWPLILTWRSTPAPLGLRISRDQWDQNLLRPSIEERPRYVQGSIVVSSNASLKSFSPSD